MSTRTHNHPCLHAPRCTNVVPCNGEWVRNHDGGVTGLARVMARKQVAVPPGMCQCGCGLPAPIANRTILKRGVVKGQPQRFILGHAAKSFVKTDRMTRQIIKGYVHLYMPSHQRADSKGYVAEHIMVAQAALGHSLPPAAVVHHRNEQPDDNRNANLVICEDQAYHTLLHWRARIYRAGGNPNTDAICSRCGVRPRGDFYNGCNGFSHDCRLCARARARERSGYSAWVPGGKGRPPREVVRA